MIALMDGILIFFARAEFFVTVWLKKSGAEIQLELWNQMVVFHVTGWDCKQKQRVVCILKNYFSVGKVARTPRDFNAGFWQVTI